MEQLVPGIFTEFGLSSPDKITKIGSGHINRTFLVETVQDEKYIVQELNTKVFKHPEVIAENLRKLSRYLVDKHPDYLFPAPMPSVKDQMMIVADGNFWRVLPFVDNTIAHDTLSNPKQAYEASKQFGKFCRLLSDFPINELNETIPGFHDLNLRVAQFKQALDDASNPLKQQAQRALVDADHFNFIVAYFNSFENSSELPNRVIHHDTKISNVLLDKDTSEGVCVIDLDTVMPGKFISDLGDMMRTYVCAFSENETDLEKITLRLDYFKATIDGYLSEMGAILTKTETELILFSGKYIIYMQALRFLTDHLNGNIYYPVNYQAQNLDRANNQFKLLKEYFKHESVLQDIIENALADYR